jgi:hypothetical protein
MGKVLSEELAKCAGNDALARPLSATEGNRNTYRLIRVLNGIGHPFDQIIIMLTLSRAYDVENVVA